MSTDRQAIYTTKQIVGDLRYIANGKDSIGFAAKLDGAADRLEQQEQRIAEMEKTRIIQSPDAAVALANAIELSEAKERIVELERELAAAKEDLHHNDACSVCIGAEQGICKDCDLECLDCRLDCRCKDCRDENKWEWRGAREGEW
jgi:hypothetical protein